MARFSDYASLTRFTYASDLVWRVLDRSIARMHSAATPSLPQSSCIV